MLHRSNQLLTTILSTTPRNHSQTTTTITTHHQILTSWNKTHPSSYNHRQISTPTLLSLRFRRKLTSSCNQMLLHLNLQQQLICLRLTQMNSSQLGSWRSKKHHNRQIILIFRSWLVIRTTNSFLQQGRIMISEVAMDGIKLMSHMWGRVSLIKRWTGDID